MTLYTLTTYGPREYLCRLGLVPGTLKFIPKRILIADVQKAVARHFGLPVAVMSNAQKAYAVSRPRQIAMYLARNLTGQSVTNIAQRFARDHTTVLHALKQVTKRKETDAELANDLDTIERELRA